MALVPLRGTLLVLCSLLLPAFAVAEGEKTELLREQLAMERVLLEDTLRRYDQLRSQEERYIARLADLAGQLDALLQGDAGVDEVAALDQAVELASVTAQGLTHRVGETRQQVLDHLRRVELLEALLETEEPVVRRDPISGRWQVLVRPSGIEGVFELELDGALVQGQYRLDGGFSGSLRGTFVNGKLELERIDTRRGFDVVYHGRLSDDGERIDGTWRSTLLTAPGAAGGQWRALRLETDID